MVLAKAEGDSVIYQLLYLAISIQEPPKTPVVPPRVPATTAAEPPPASTTPTPPTPPPSTPMDRVSWSRVVMVEKGGQHDMDAVPGSFGATSAFVTVLMYSDFPGATAELHIKDAQPVFYVRSDQSPRGRIFLVKAEHSRQGRSVKMGKSGFGSMSGMMTPDSDWTIEFTYKETTTDGVWMITPKTILPKGEYGIYEGINSMGYPAPGGSLFDFAID